MTSLFRRERWAANKATAGGGGLTVDELLLLPTSGTVKSFHIVADAVDPNEDGPLLSEGVVELPKESTDDFDFGEAVFVDDPPTQVEDSAVGHYRIGYCVDPGGAATGTTTCLVKLHGAPIDQVT